LSQSEIEYWCGICTRQWNCRPSVMVMLRRLLNFCSFKGKAQSLCIWRQGAFRLYTCRAHVPSVDITVVSWSLGQKCEESPGSGPLRHDDHPHRKTAQNTQPRRRNLRIEENIRPEIGRLHPLGTFRKDSVRDSTSSQSPCNQFKTSKFAARILEVF